MTNRVHRICFAVADQLLSSCARQCNVQSTLNYTTTSGKRMVFSSSCFFRVLSTMHSSVKHGGWISRKAEILAMPLEERRKLYRCGANNVATLNDIPTWSEYAIEHGLLESGNGMSESANTVSLFEGNITAIEIDVIVNAANESLLGGGGVDGAIHSAAGHMLFEECRSLKGCATGDAKISGGYNLPAKYVIHTVGPKGENATKLRSCYQRSLDLARKNNLRTIAFPCISTGIYGYPNDAAAVTALETVRDWLQDDAGINSFDRIIFCVFLEKDLKLYEQNMLEIFAAGADRSENSASQSQQIQEELTTSFTKINGEKTTQVHEQQLSHASGQRLSLVETQDMSDEVGQDCSAYSRKSVRDSENLSRETTKQSNISSDLTEETARALPRPRSPEQSAQISQSPSNDDAKAGQKHVHIFVESNLSQHADPLPNPKTKPDMQIKSSVHSAQKGVTSHDDDSQSPTVEQFNGKSKKARTQSPISAQQNYSVYESHRSPKQEGDKIRKKSSCDLL